MEIDWLRAAVTVAFGALAGGITNRVAVWMLFHPYRPPSLFGRPVSWLQGAVPKNQQRLADSVGSVVGGALLTPEDIATELGQLETAFQERLRELAIELTAGEQPSLADLLPEPALLEIRRLLVRLLSEGREFLAGALDSPEFREEASRLLDSVRESLSEEPLSRTIEPERVAAVRRAVEGWLAGLLDSAAFEATVRRHLDEAAGHMLSSHRTFEQLIPPGLLAALEHAVKDYLPVAMGRLSRLLDDPGARERIERLIGELLDRFMQDLRFHQRVVARFIVTEETVARALNTLQEEGADRVGTVLRETEVQAAIARNVNEGVVEFLRHPPSDVLGAAGDPQVESALDSISEWLVAAARDPASRAFLLDRIEDIFERFGERTWADVLRAVPADRVASSLAHGFRSDAGRAMFDSIAEPLADRMLHTPIGRLDRFLHEDAAARLADTLAAPAWDWIARRVPEVAGRIRIADRISSKIEGFSIRRIEGLVRDISQREFDLIVRLGYVLGAVIGTGLVILDTLPVLEFIRGLLG
ncbi:DUF445 family protein [Candidatus Palauibacter sp.]|uniref:DUF445 family protein n=1 Tax=Candidatus Palauibacter sp. TaxID=3101350 RepID=UPI003AF2DB69